MINLSGLNDYSINEKLATVEEEELTEILKQSVEKANKEIYRVYDYIKENKDAFEYQNLKLHDAHYYSYRELEKDFPILTKNYTTEDLFYMFCNDSFDLMVDDLKYIHNIDFSDHRFHLGRTSSFKLYNDRVLRLDNINMDLIRDIVDYSIGYLSFFDMLRYSNKYNIIADDLITDDRNLLIETIGELQIIINELFTSTKFTLKDIIIVYDWLNYFKNSQVKAFIQYLKQIKNGEIFNHNQNKREKRKKKITS